MRLYMYAAGVVVILLAIFGIYRAGQQVNEAKHQAAVVEQQLADAKAIVEIKERENERQKTLLQTRTTIQRIPDSTGCAATPVPRARVERVREFYRSGP